MKSNSENSINLYSGNVHNFYYNWPTPVCIISDGPYGISGYQGDLVSHNGLDEIYEPHIKAWSDLSSSSTTLWFWNTEVGWATVHPVIEKHGWEYRGLNVWNKGIGHISGNCNGKTMRKFPTVTEVCAHYVRKPEFIINNKHVSLQDWFRSEWKRSGLPYSKANEACGVKNAASRKYLSSDHLWYAPSSEIFTKMALYANLYGNPTDLPYFDLSKEEVGNKDLIANKWQKIQSVFNFEYGVTNVWDCPPVHGQERIKVNGKTFHPNQKPKALWKRIIEASSRENDFIWDVFCGSGSGLSVASQLNRKVFSAEINQGYFDNVCERLNLI